MVCRIAPIFQTYNYTQRTSLPAQEYVITIVDFLSANRDYNLLL